MARPVMTAINSTPLGLKPKMHFRSKIPGSQGVPQPGSGLRLGGNALGARITGSRDAAADGRVMLVAQGAYAFERFFPGVIAPREIMAAAVDRALVS